MSLSGVFDPFTLFSFRRRSPDRPDPTSQGGDTGSNPVVDYRQRPRSDALYSLNAESAGPFVPHLSRGRPRHVTASAAET